MTGLAALSAAAFWAVASLIYVGLGRRITAPSLNLLKSLLALGLLGGTMLVVEQSLWPSTLQGWDLAWIAASGVIGLAIGDTAFFWALTRIGARRSLLIFALAPALTALLCTVTLGEPFGIIMALGIGLTTAGVGWVITEQETGAEAGNPIDALGVGLALVAAGCQAVANLMIRMISAEPSALGLSVARLAFGVLAMGVLVGLMGRTRELTIPMRWPGMVPKLFVACFLGTYLGIWLTTGAMHGSQTGGVASMLASTSPLFILPLAWVVMGERISMRSFAGATVAVLGIGLLFAQEQSASLVPEPTVAPLTADSVEPSPEVDASFDPAEPTPDFEASGM